MKKFILRFLLAVFIIFAVSIWPGNNWLQISNYTFKSKNVPQEFNGFKIVQISDLHCKEFGKHNSRLLKHVKKLKPDIIVLTGDVIDYKVMNMVMVESLAEQLPKIAPVYYITGNHEHWSDLVKDMEIIMKDNDINLMDNERKKIKRDGAKIYLSGIADPEGFKSNSDFTKKLKKLRKNRELNILLSHRAERFQQYTETGYDLVFAGHAHGGQFRIPFGGGIVSPNQGYFPKYTDGMHVKDGTSMVISRGLGNSVIPFRVFNRPEIVVVTLETE